MRATLKDEHGKVLIDVFDCRDVVPDLFSEEIGDLIDNLDEPGTPARFHVTWTVVVSS